MLLPVLAHVGSWRCVLLPSCCITMFCVIGGTESLLSIVWEPLFPGGCTSWINPQQLSLLCENEEHRGLGSVLWLLELFVYHIPVGSSVVLGKEESS